jgi:hypothetical protein
VIDSPPDSLANGDSVQVAGGGRGKPNAAR